MTSADGGSLVLVEHANEQSAGFGVEVAPVAVDQRLAELSGRDPTRAVSVHRLGGVAEITCSQSLWRHSQPTACSVHVPVPETSPTVHWRLREEAGHRPLGGPLWPRSCSQAVAAGTLDLQEAGRRGEVGTGLEGAGSRRGCTAAAGSPRQAASPPGAGPASRPGSVGGNTRVAVRSMTWGTIPTLR